MKKIMALTSALALSAVMLTGCASKLEGKWTLTDKDGEPTSITVKFKEDDKVILDGHKGKWEQVDKDTVKFKGFNDDFMNGKFTFDIVSSKDGYLCIEGMAEALEESDHVMTYRTSASSLYKAINTALVEMDEEGYYLDEPLIISSDSSLDSGVEFKDPNGKRADTDYFYEKVENYFSDYEEYEFVAYISRICTAWELLFPEGQRVLLWEPIPDTAAMTSLLLTTMRRSSTRRASTPLRTLRNTTMNMQRRTTRTKWQGYTPYSAQARQIPPILATSRRAYSSTAEPASSGSRQP